MKECCKRLQEKIYEEQRKNAEFIEFRLFEKWYNDRPLKDPQVAITASAARQIAFLIYEKERCSEQ